MTMNDMNEAAPKMRWQFLRNWYKRRKMADRFAVFVAFLIVISAIITFFAFKESSPIGGDANNVTILLLVNLSLLLLLIALILRRVVQLWLRRKQGIAGSRLHLRLAVLFSVLAVVPSFIVAVTSLTFLFTGIQSWFSERVRTAITDSREVAEAYLDEHRDAIRGDILAMANNINSKAALLMVDENRMNLTLAGESQIRGLTEAQIFDGSNRVLGQYGFLLGFEFDPISETDLEKANQDEIVLLISEDEDRVRALIKLARFVDAYLVVGRPLDPEVLSRVDATTTAVDEYEQLVSVQSRLQVTGTFIYVMVVLLLLVLAIWIGLHIATRFITPVASLISAAELIRAGDLSVRVEEEAAVDELVVLARAFNRMAQQLKTHRQDLMVANAQLDNRRRFIETVVEGVTAGVIGLDEKQRFTLVNSAAMDILDQCEDTHLIGLSFQDILPEMAELIEKAHAKPGRVVEGEIQLTRARKTTRQLLVKIFADHDDQDVKSYVVTFDDVTELVGAQRKAAWADVARRIAHEIKNPLTPIQLSAERLKRRYLKQIEDGADVFEVCTDTIIRQVQSIGRMVDEFSSFARMPQPVMRAVRLNKLLDEILFLSKSGNPDIQYHINHLPVDVVCYVDREQISQLFINLLQNAADAIEGRKFEAEQDYVGEISVSVTYGREAETDVTVLIEDNGIGLPDERGNLTEPYVTTREKGTGLGLAIVKKILEDHEGILQLSDREDGQRGALVSVSLPVREAEEQDALENA